MKSYWLNDSKKSQYKELTSNLETDILIIGGGITGILQAYTLKDTGMKITLVDQNQLYHATTGYTTGKISYQHSDIYHKLINQYNKEIALAYYEANRAGFNYLNEIIKEHKIDCDYQFATSYLFDNSNNNQLDKEEEAYIAMGIAYEKTSFKEFPALAFSNQAFFHVVKFLDKILDILKAYANITIYENTKIIKTKEENDVIAYTNDFEIRCKYIISACMYPVYRNFNLYFTKLKPVMSYATVAKNTSFPSDKIAININNPIVSLRPLEKDKIIFAGWSKEVNKINNYDEICELKNEGHSKYDNSKYYETWYNQDYQTPDYLPYIGPLSERILFAIGFNKWGITQAAISSIIIYDYIMKNDNQYLDIFTPARDSKLLKEMAIISKSIYVLIKSKIKYRKYHLNFKQKKIKMICPHMHCTLRYNSQSNTYDCPCHGSRFDEDGQVIVGPSQKNLDSL